MISKLFLALVAIFNRNRHVVQFLVENITGCNFIKRILWGAFMLTYFELDQWLRRNCHKKVHSVYISNGNFICAILVKGIKYVCNYF